MKNCKICNKKLGSSNKSGFCMKHLPRDKENNHNFKHGLTFNKKCKFCGKEISYYNDRCRDCWKKELSQLYIGEGNPSYKENKTCKLYPLGWSATYREQIRFRDGYKCQICGCSEIENKRKLSVHHKDYNKMNIEENNLISLCQSCHSKTNSNRKYWLEYFKVESGVVIDGVQPGNE